MNRALDLPLRTVTIPEARTEVVDRSALTAPGAASGSVWSADQPTSHDFASAIDRTASGGLDREKYATFFRNPTLTTDPLRYIGLRDCHVALEWGVVVTPDGAVNKEASFNAVWHTPDLSALRGVVRVDDRTCVTAAALNAAPRIEGGHVLLHHAGRTNYGHWMMDCVLGVWPLLDDIRDGRLGVLAAPLQGWHRDTLVALGVPRARVTETGSPWVHCDYVIVPSSLNMSGFHAPSPLLVECIRALRRTCAAPHQPGSQPRRIYVSREPRERRRMTNEADVIRALDARGFAVVHPGRLSIAEQIHLFAGADCVVGAHGSGMFNVAFMNPGTHVVEISPAVSNPRLWIGRLSSAFGLHYAVVVVDVADDACEETVRHGVSRRDLDYRYAADVPAVLHALDVFGIH